MSESHAPRNPRKSKESFHLPASRRELPLSILAGAAFALLLFVVMALAQMMGDVEPPRSDLDDSFAAYVPPTIEEVEDEEPPPPEKQEPPPELEAASQQLSLEQLDIALNPGTGGSLAGDFSMAMIATSGGELGTEDFVDFSDLDQLPRPIGVSGFNFPARLKRKKASGKIVLIIRLDQDGNVIDAEIDQSNLPNFDDFVRNEVASWKFTPPTRNGRPVKAHARLPIPINIR
jgi:protein TonB